MAITGRSARTFEADVSHTPDVVGPGSYLTVQREMPIHGCASHCTACDSHLLQDCPVVPQPHITKRRVSELCPPQVCAIL